MLLAKQARVAKCAVNGQIVQEPQDHLGPTRKRRHIFLRLIEESFGPFADRSLWVYLRRNYPAIRVNRAGKEVKSNVGGIDCVGLYGESDAVQHVIAMGLNDYLHASTGSSSKELPDLD